VMASRGRSSALKQNIPLIYDLAKYPDNIEVLIRFDNDDKESLYFYKNDEIFKKYKNIKIFVGPRWGYKYIPLCISQLFAETRGDIISAIADDSVTALQDWDEKLLQFKDQIAVMGWRARNCFTRKAYDKYEFLQTFAFGRAAADQLVWRWACKKGIFIRTGKSWAKTVIKDQTYREGAQGEWSLSDKDLLDVPMKEL